MNEPFPPDVEPNGRFRLLLWLPVAVLVLKAIAIEALYAIDTEAVCDRMNPGGGEFICGGSKGYASPYLDVLDFFLFAAVPFAAYGAYRRFVLNRGSSGRIAKTIDIAGLVLSSLAIAMWIAAAYYFSNDGP